MDNVYIHPTAIVEEGAKIGKGSYVWHFAHIRSTAVLGENVIIGKGVYIDSNVAIGDNSKVQNLVSVYQGVSIGRNVFVGPHVVFTNDLYPRIGYDWEITKTVIGDHVSIGSNSTIVCGSKLDDYSFIAAGSLIPASRYIPKFALVMGNPGRIRAWVCKCARKLLDTTDTGFYDVTCAHCHESLSIEVSPMKKIN
ncbi:MAG: N-acetyltransferase [Candidatus Heimdallarchaeota archaeon]|nr:N-acetyltransferase [Candidatus Heimdallarchaeota archaeon]